MAVPRYLINASMLAFAMLIVGSALAQSREPTTEANRQFIAQAFDQWSAGGRTFFQDVTSPDVVWTIKGTSPVAGTYKGRDDFLRRAVAPFAARLSSPIKPKVKDIWADGNDVIVHWEGSATATDGATYRNSYVWIFRMHDLRATEVVAFLDLVPFDDVIRRIPLDAQGATH